ncbi:MAG: hypothetical protein V4510_04450 [bacterium]
MGFTQEEALARIVALTMRAGRPPASGQGPSPWHRVPHAFEGMTDAQVRRLVAAGQEDVAQRGEEDVLTQALAALSGHSARVTALRVACVVAGDDRMLSWSETSHLSRLAKRLGLSRRDVGRVVRSAP